MTRKERALYNTLAVTDIGESDSKHNVQSNYLFYYSAAVAYNIVRQNYPLLQSNIRSECYNHLIKVVNEL